MLVGFKEEFKEKVLDGSKIHTIRPIPKRMPKIGETLIMATGVRTKHYKKFAEYPLQAMQRIIVGYESIVVEHTLLSFESGTELAINDGFESFKALLEWFEKMYKTDKHPFCGCLYHWTDKRY